MHKLKKQAVNMKEALLRWELNKIWKILNDSWQAKKSMASEISNELIDEIYNKAMESWAIWWKISGAWWGWFMMFYCDWENKYKVIEELKKFGWDIRKFNITNEWLTTWKL
jgi:D-glycero-alpha-D-manno-heptose-7-phosphate kinase